MWFCFGLVTLIGSALLMYRFRREERWVGAPSGRLNYQELRNPKSNRLTALWVRIAIDPALDFELKRETWLDRLAKRLGVSEEAQVGRPGFDASCYLVSDDPAIRSRFRTDARLTERLREIAAYDSGWRFHRLICRNGRLKVILRPSGGPPLEPTLGWLRQHLEALADGAPPSLLRKPGRDPYLLRSLAVLSGSTGLAVAGFVNLVHLLVLPLPFTMDLGKLWALTLPVAVALLFALVAATALLLARTSRAHLVLAEVLLVGSFGALATAWTELRDFNIEADGSAAEGLPSVVGGKYVHRGRRGSRSYYLVLGDWNGGARARRVQVPYELYLRFAPGQPVRVLQHPGALHVRWVEAIEPAAP